jgi:glycine/D-amino acid oxidase-like deaminating enzyme
MFATVRKAVGAFLGGLTAAAVAAGFGLFGVTLGPELALALATLLATLGAYLAPKNEETPA